MGQARPWILGISASHNGAYCLLHGDELVVAVQEERLTGFKRQRVYGAAPSLALEYCLTKAGIQRKDLALVVSCMQGTPGDPRQDVALNPALRAAFNGIPLLEIPHHHGHAMSALVTSGYDDAAILVVDGSGSAEEELPDAERDVCLRPAGGTREIISLYHARGGALVPLEKHLGERHLDRGDAGMPRFASLGGLFSAAAQQIFGEESEAGKVMGLAPYGQPVFPVSSFFSLHEGRFVFSDEICRRFDGLERWPKRADEYADLAASVQQALEVALLHLTRRLRALTGSDHLCYAGGVALNSVANELILRESGFRHVFIPPAAEDSGPAIGAAYHGLWQLTGTPVRRPMGHDSVGHTYDVAEIRAAIAGTAAATRVPSADVLGTVVERLMDGQIGGWFQGGSELGPRALGQRSIICDPRRPDGKEVLNRRVKRREAFRPFAPAVLLEEVDAWFELDGTAPTSPYMLRVCRFRRERADRVPAVVHCDGTGRLQTLTRRDNGRFYELVRRFFERTDVPILLNTSFNVMGEPIVETPEDALWDLLFADLDFCVLGDEIVVRQPGYRSPLDLVPRLRATSCTITLPISREGLDLAVPDKGFVPFEVETRWGKVTQPVAAALLPLLEQIDGRSTGWEVLERYAKYTSATAESFTAALAQLRRRHIIEFDVVARLRE